MTQNISNTLHDFFPRRIWENKIRFLTFLWILLILSLIIILIAQFRNIGAISVIILILTVLLLFVSIIVAFFETQGRLATNWDDIDYSGLQKYDYKFITKDGTNHFAYIYIPEGITIDKMTQPIKTVIGFHGWGSHHREMDRYCLPIVKKEKYLYFTMDAYGQGQTTGDKNDFRQFEHAKEFLDLVIAEPFVDIKNIIVVGMSLGAAKASVIAYPHPDIKACVLLSGPYDIKFTKEAMTLSERLIFKLYGFNFDASEEIYRKCSGIEYFKPEGITLNGNSEPTANSKRVFLLANRNDPTVRVQNTLNAIEKLKLPESNYHIFSTGRHCFEGNEYFVALEISDFVRQTMNS